MEHLKYVAQVGAEQEPHSSLLNKNRAARRRHPHTSSDHRFSGVTQQQLLLAGGLLATRRIIELNKWTERRKVVRSATSLILD